MSVEVTSSNPDPAEAESPMFAPTPVWDRARKRRRFGFVRPPAKGVAAPPLTAERIRETHVAEPDPAAGEVAGHTRTATRGRSGGGVSALALAAGVVIVGALSVGGYYASHSGQGGVAELTPGQPGGAMTVAANTVPTPALAETTPEAAASVPPANAEPATPTVTRSTTVARRSPASAARVSRAPSAGESGVNASDALPATPVPYSATVSTPSMAAPAIAVNPPPSPPAVAPAPMDTAPSTHTASPPQAMGTAPATSADPSAATMP
jgi:hypothetical protein